MRGSFAYACLTGVVGVFCTGAWAQTPVFSVRLGGYAPNTYGQCRVFNDFGGLGGDPCTQTSDCADGQRCGKMFRDISCTDDADCQAATGGPSKCIDIEVPGVGGTLTVQRCGPIENAPEGMIQPGMTVFLEVYADEWDQTPDEGLCENGVNSCGVGELDQCKSCHALNNPPGAPCLIDSDCAEPGIDCRPDAHCELNGVDTGAACDVVGGVQCGSGRDCVGDECEVWPAITGYQWQFDSSSFSNHGPLSALLPGAIPCTAATEVDDCKHGYVTECDACLLAQCDRVDGEGNPICALKANGFVYSGRLDYIFAGLDPTLACSTSTADYSCGGVVVLTAAVADDPAGFPRYLGTAVLTVSELACGTFRVGLLDDPIKTFANDQSGETLPNALTANDVSITIGPAPTCTIPNPRCDDGNLCTANICNCSNVCINPPNVDCEEGFACNPSTGECEEVAGCELTGMSSTPPDCSIDPGIPHAIDATAPALGWNTIDLEFDSVTGCDTSVLTSGDFSVAVTPPDVTINVDGVSGTGSTATVTLSGPIPAQHWVCLTHDGPAATGGPETVCQGALPADSDANQTSESADIGAVIDCLVSGTCEVWKCDIDRLEACTGADIEETVNLLNGAGEFDSWDTVQMPVLPACPVP